MSNKTLRGMLGAAAPSTNGVPAGAAVPVGQITITMLSTGQVSVDAKLQTKLQARQMLNAARDLIEDQAPPEPKIEVASAEQAEQLLSTTG